MTIETAMTQGARAGSEGPVVASERIEALDVLRGFAVLGILVMNIQYFSMISAAYFNPAASPFFDGIDRWIWVASHLLTDQKFMTLFSMLFGAGIVLMTDRLDASGRRTAAIHYRRTFWLLLIGIVHAYLFWYGDVLVWYALCGFLVYLMRKVRPRRLLVVGLCGLLVGSLLNLFTGLSIPQMPEETVQEMLMGDWRPTPEAIAEEEAAYRGGFAAQLEKRIPTAFGMHTFVFLFFGLWRAGSLMLIGMALYKLGVLSAARSAGFYRNLTAVGLPVGLALVAYGVIRNMSDGWTIEYARFFGSQYNHWGSVLVSCGYIGVIMLWCQGSLWASLKERFAAVGRMALTNYLSQTLICTFIFYGHGLGWFQSANRTLQILIVVAVWALQLVWSPWWLRSFRFGPAEWLWRSLTYWRAQPLRRG